MREANSILGSTHQNLVLRPFLLALRLLIAGEDRRSNDTAAFQKDLLQVATKGFWGDTWSPRLPQTTTSHPVLLSKQYWDGVGGSIYKQTNLID